MDNEQRTSFAIKQEAQSQPSSLTLSIQSLSDCTLTFYGISIRANNLMLDEESLVPK